MVQSMENGASGQGSLLWRVLGGEGGCVFNLDIYSTMCCFAAEHVT